MTKVVHDYSKVPGFEYMSSPDWIIGNRPFRIRAPAYLMANEAAIEAYGSFYSGDPRRDAAAAKVMEDGYRTILQMFEIWQERGAIQLVNRDEDIKTIHSVIQAYFEDLAHYQRQYLGGDAKLRVHAGSDHGTYVRLMAFAREFDTFAKDVFSLAIRSHLSKPEEQEDLMEMPIPTEQRQGETKRLADYSPVSDVIDFSRLSSRKRY